MFPNGWPGRALLLLRLVIAFFLIHDGIVGVMGGPKLAWFALHAVAAIAGIFFLLGLWTPIAGVVVTLIELCISVSHTDDLRSTILLGTIALAIAILGPGARSIDALLFGRKRLDIEVDRSRFPPPRK